LACQLKKIKMWYTLRNSVMDNIVSYLKQLDLSDVEAKIYLTLLKTGPLNIRDLAQAVNLKRTTAYVYVDQLIEKGLIIKLVKGSKKFVAANEPDNLNILAEEKLKKATEVQHNFPEILQMITAALPQEKQADQSEIKNYAGKTGVKKLYTQALKSKELRSIVNIEEILSAFPENADIFDEAINHNPGMIMYEIVVQSPEAIARMKQATGRTKNYYFKFLPGTMNIRSTDILIYDGNVSFIEIKNHINAVTLHSKELYNNFILLFDYIWQTLPKPEQ
jgi:sugar-specific transcriptional regulator TrmB